MAFLDPGQPVRTWLAPIGALHGFAVRLRRWCYQRGWLVSSRLPCRVVSVGNLTVGGTGKTPVVILLTQWLQAEGQRVAVLSRGYKRRGGPRHLLVSDGTRLLATADESGDEPYLIARRCPEAIVAVGADRAVLGRWVLEGRAVDCIILDDGFQHWALHRDVDLVLLDATDATGLDAMLPAGRLREPMSALARATAIAVTRADAKEDVAAVCRRVQMVRASLPEPTEIVFRPELLVSVVNGQCKPLADCRGKTAWLVSGIGNSGSFQQSAASIGITTVGQTVFPDHHDYRADDVRRVRPLAQARAADFVLTTEKDAGKLVPFLTPDDNWWALRIRAEVVQGEAQLRRLVCSSATHGRTHVHA